MLNAELGGTAMELQLLKYLGKDWSGRRSLEAKPDELSIWTFESFDGNSKVSMVSISGTCTYLL